MLLLGLAIGLLGSYTDDLLGSGSAVAVLQVGLWIACAALLVPALIALKGRNATAPGGRLSRGHA